MKVATNLLHGLIVKHSAKLKEAKGHLLDLACWSGFAEIPSEKFYGEGAKQAGEEAFKSLLGNSLDLGDYAMDLEVGGEESPYGIDVDVKYPVAAVPELLRRAAGQVVGKWADATPKQRACVLLEVMDRLSARSFEMAHAVMHTTGQPFMMAFQAGGAHALDRALEAVAAATELQERWPEKVRWVKPQGKRAPIVLDKRYSVRPRGVGLVIGCSTFPTWNGYPGLFASLACGNPVIVKPHPAVRLPLAIAVQEIRATLAEAGFAPDVVQLALDSAEKPITKELATMPEVALVDYTGSSAFGHWLEEECRAHVFAEKSGRNSAVVSDFADLDGMAKNLALSLCLYSGQMCTSPQDIYIVSNSNERYEQVAAAIVSAVEGLLADDAKAVEILGAVASSATMDRLADSAKDNIEVLASRRIKHPKYSHARIHTPALITPGKDGGKLLQRELFGPMAVIYRLPSFEEALDRVKSVSIEQGALSSLVYSDDESQVGMFEKQCAMVGVNCAANLTGMALVNHSAAFSDFHGTGANPAAGASLTDVAFVAPRFFVHEKRRQGA